MSLEQLNQTQIDPRIGRAQEIKGFYDFLYQNDFEDSPEQSRISMAKRTHQALQSLPSSAVALDVGSGIQVTQALYEKTYGIPSQRVITLDYAETDIEEGKTISIKDRLMAPDFEHTIASGTHLPFPDEAFSLLTSNMALDFMPIASLGEVQRVLKQGARVILNMHHPNLIPSDLNFQINLFDKQMSYKEKHSKPLSRRQKMKRTAFNQMSTLRDEKILYESEDQIRSAFEPLGFEIERIEEVSDRKDTWWEVDMTKMKGGVK